MYLSKPILQRYLLRFLEVDLGLGDITTSVLISSQTKASAKIVLKEAKPVFLAGLEEVICLLEALEIKTKSAYQDGVWAKPHVVNILMRMTALATMTKNIQDRIKAIGSRSKVAATRKTLPGFIYFDKKAVAIGGGDTHRFHLEDAILIKNNHLILVGSIAEALKQARRTSFSKKIEIEVSNLEEALIAATLGADIIMLDNFPPKMVGETINALTQKGLREKVLIEVSGRITPETVLDYAIYNPDIISCGALTHSVRAIDVSLKIEK